MAQLGGAIADVPADATAYSHRDAAYNVNVNGSGFHTSPSAIRRSRGTRGFFDAIEPYQTGVYVNFLDRDDHDRLRSAYGDERTDDCRTSRPITIPITSPG